MVDGSTHPRKRVSDGRMNVLNCAMIFQNVDWSFDKMMGWRKMLSKIICMVIGTFIPVDYKLSLGGTAAEPMVSHVP